jgi:hypothetical protein
MTTKPTINKIAERLSRPDFYLHCAAVDRLYDEKPKDIPTLAVVRDPPFDYTATYDDPAGASVPPPGRGWREFGRRGESTLYRRALTHDYFANEARVTIVSRYDDARELDVLDAVVREIPDKVRRFIDQVFCDSKHGAIAIDLTVADDAVAACVGELFAAGLRRIVRGHGGVSVNSGSKHLYRVEGSGE